MFMRVRNYVIDAKYAPIFVATAMRGEDEEGRCPSFCRTSCARLRHVPGNFCADTDTSPASA